MTQEALRRQEEFRERNLATSIVGLVKVGRAEAVFSYVRQMAHFVQEVKDEAWTEAALTDIKVFSSFVE